MFFQPAWFKTNGGSCDSDMLSHNNINMAWLLVKMAWFCFHLVQLNKFWTSNTPTFAKWQHLKQGYFYFFQ
jgi:hypothetical protein